MVEKNGIDFAMVLDEGGTICENFMGLVDGLLARLHWKKAHWNIVSPRFLPVAYAANPQPNSAIVRLAELMHDVEKEDLFIRKLSDGNRAMLKQSQLTARAKRQNS